MVQSQPKYRRQFKISGLKCKAFLAGISAGKRIGEQRKWLLCQVEVALAGGQTASRRPYATISLAVQRSVGHFLGFDGDSFARDNLQHIMQNFLDVR